MRCLPMINKHKKFLTAAVFCAIASTGFVLTASAEETMTHDLDEVVVEADKDALPGSYVKTKGSIGILGEKSVLDVPFSNMNITQKTIETFGGPNQPLQSILANNPAVRIQGTTLHNDFSIRGIKGNGKRYQFLPKRYPRSNDSICRPYLYDWRHSIYFRP